MQYSLYFHIPFCRHRCAYCDFNTYAGQEELIPAYVAALCREAQMVGANAPQNTTIHTIYFGGGTPSLLAAGQVREILASVSGAFCVADETEITLEANPGTISAEDLRALRSAGVSRISFGVQSANAEELRLLERGHTYLDVLAAVSAARTAGFDNISLDLIYGLPEQTLETWQTTVKRIVDLGPEHISAYALTLEHGTPFSRWTLRGLMPAPDPDLAADMYEWLCLTLNEAGYGQYEISNWARQGYACRHNLQYWRGQPYLGLGAGAHGYAHGYRYSNVLGIRAYIDRLNSSRRSYVQQAAGSDQGQCEHAGSRVPRLAFPLSPVAVNQHLQTSRDDIEEFMINGLRLTREGVAPSTFRRRFGSEITQWFGREVEELKALGLLEHCKETSEIPVAATAHWEESSEVLRLTERGRLLGNQVFVRFVH